MEESKVCEYHVLQKDGEHLIFVAKYNPDGSQVLHIPGDPDFSNLVDFADYLDEHYGDEE